MGAEHPSAYLPASAVDWLDRLDGWAAMPGYRVDPRARVRGVSTELLFMAARLAPPRPRSVGWWGFRAGALVARVIPRMSAEVLERRTDAQAGAIQSIMAGLGLSPSERGKVRTYARAVARTLLEAAE